MYRGVSGCIGVYRVGKGCIGEVKGVHSGGQRSGVEEVCTIRRYSYSS